MHELIGLSGCRMVELLDKGEITPEDALDALEERIGLVEPKVHALPTLCFERARDHARRLRDLPARDRGLLRGLPVPIKDLTNVAGVRTTHGSKLFEHHVPQSTGVVAENLESNGAIIYAKSNTPEFGTGGHSFNDIYETTCNPRDLRKSAGGSSGGAAAALASGMAWLAHGSDMAGSLRTPAGFCGVASLRPSPGLIATDPKPIPFMVLGQEGPMARSVEDLALLADAMSGASHRSALAKPVARTSFLEAARDPSKPARIAVSADLGLTGISDETAAAFESFVAHLGEAGLSVTRAAPDLDGADEALAVQRALIYASGHGATLDKTRDIMKPEVVWNVEQGLAVTADEIRSALSAHGRVFAAAVDFMQSYDVLVCPATAHQPFPIEERYVGHAAGVPIPQYNDWLRIVHLITATSLPVITIPVGFASDGLPFAVQLVGKPHGERQLFSISRFLEERLGWDSSPVDPA